MMLYPIGIQNFEDLRCNEYVYVDKTEHIHNLISTGKYYFLSRPRRFGKSLLLSTIEAYFQGKRELFTGLAIEKMGTEWEEYPVLHIDLNSGRYIESKDLDVVLHQHLNNWEIRYGIVAKYDDFAARFNDVIDAAFHKTGKKVVILIDEYDKPIVNNIGNDELTYYYKKTLQGFYSVLKVKDGQIRFGFLTGVSKIGKMSVFSGLNNLKDISMEARYADICGISENDLHKYFSESVAALAQANGMGIDECFDKLRQMYDGYHFSEKSDGMYNPFSLLNTFSSKTFRDYWFETGTPTLLVNVMKRTSFDVTSLSDNVMVSVEDLSGMHDIVNRPVPLFFQTGYLTIKDYDSEFQEYRLGFPNEEVRKGFLKFIYSYYVPVNPAEGNTTTSKLARALRSGRTEDFMNVLDTIFSGATYQIAIDNERSLQQAIYIIMELLGEYVEAERHTSNGRIDILLKTKDFIYIVELKVNSTADAALKQIEDKGYARPFASDTRKIYKIGINFSTKERRINEWKIM